MLKIRKSTIGIFTLVHLIPQLIYPPVFVKNILKLVVSHDFDMVHVEVVLKLKCSEKTSVRIAPAFPISITELLRQLV